MTTLTPNTVFKPTQLLKKTLLVTSNRRSRTIGAVGLEPLRVAMPRWDVTMCLHVVVKVQGCLSRRIWETMEASSSLHDEI